MPTSQVKYASPQIYAEWVEDYLSIPGRQVMVSYNAMPNDILLIEDTSDIASLESIELDNKGTKQLAIVLSGVEVPRHLMLKISPLRFTNIVDVHASKLDSTPICFSDTLPAFLKDEYTVYLSANARRGTLWLKESTKDIAPISRSFHPIWVRCEGESTEHILFSPELLPSVDDYLEDFLGMSPTLAATLQDIYKQVTDRGIKWEEFCSNLIDADELKSLSLGEIAHDRQGRTIFTISKSCELPFLGDNPPRIFFVAPGVEAVTVGSEDGSKPRLIPLQSVHDYH